MRLLLGLHITDKGQWTTSNVYLPIDEGVVVTLDNGSHVAVTSQGAVMRFDKDGAQVE